VVEWYFRRVYGAVQLEGWAEGPLLMGGGGGGGGGWEGEGDWGGGRGRDVGSTSARKNAARHSKTTASEAATTSPSSYSSSSSSSAPSSSSSPPSSSSHITPHDPSHAFLDRCRTLMTDALFGKLVDAIVAFYEGRVRPAVLVGQVRELLMEAAVGAGAAAVAGAGVAITTTAAPATGGITSSTELTVITNKTTLGNAGIGTATITSAGASASASATATATASATATAVASELFEAFVVFLPAHIRELAQ
jgi:hypothetical protein